jgi:hypothetical protein
VRALTDFETFVRGLTELEVDGNLARRAGQLADDHDLRALDALHLASALTLGPGSLLVTWDLALARAGQSSGLAVAPPPSPQPA